MAVKTTVSSGRSLTPASAQLPAHSFGPRGSPRFQTVTAAFFHHAAAHPDTPAALDLASAKGAAITVSYRELAARAARLSSTLRRLGVGPGSRVPLVVKRGVDMLVSIVAVLSCGAQYVPLDGGVVPDTTLRFVVEQTGGQSGVVVALKATKHRMAAFEGVEVVVVDELEAADAKDESPYAGYVDLAKPGDGCYIIYTSGKRHLPIYLKAC
jgi:acyl-CoA synthetase (AMP-forming)/AMP-acid ligase II